MCQTGRGSDRPVGRSLGHHYFSTFTKIALFPANVKVLVEALKVVDAFARADDFPALVFDSKPLPPVECIRRSIEVKGQVLPGPGSETVIVRGLE